jgi:hypothetical protein
MNPSPKVAEEEIDLAILEENNGRSSLTTWTSSGVGQLAEHHEN